MAAVETGGVRSTASGAPASTLTASAPRAAAPASSTSRSDSGATSPDSKTQPASADGLEYGELSGSMINELAVEHVLGRGAYGVVYFAHGLTRAETFALKTMSRSALKSRKEFVKVGGRMQVATALDKVRRELAIMRKVSHPCVVRCHDILDDEKKDRIILVLEWVQGGEAMTFTPGKEGPGRYFSRIMRRHGGDVDDCTFDLGQLRRITSDLLDGLEYLHSIGIVHRDLKPENCLLTGPGDGAAAGPSPDANDVYASCATHLIGRAKLADLGVAHMYDETAKDDMLRKTEGTPAFHAPEACTSLPFSGKASDMWALGCCVYIFATGRLPFSPSAATTQAQLYAAIVNDPIDFEAVLHSRAVLSLPLTHEGLATAACFMDFLQALLSKDVHERLSVEEARAHPWITGEMEHVTAQLYSEWRERINTIRASDGAALPRAQLRASADTDDTFNDAWSEDMHSSGGGAAAVDRASAAASGSSGKEERLMRSTPLEDMPEVVLLHASSASASAAHAAWMSSGGGQASPLGISGSAPRGRRWSQTSAAPLTEGAQSTAGPHSSAGSASVEPPVPLATDAASDAVTPAAPPLRRATSGPRAQAFLEAAVASPRPALLQTALPFSGGGGVNAPRLLGEEVHKLRRIVLNPRDVQAMHETVNDTFIGVDHASDDGYSLIRTMGTAGGGSSNSAHRSVQLLVRSRIPRAAPYFAPGRPLKVTDEELQLAITPVTTVRSLTFFKISVKRMVSRFLVRHRQRQAALSAHRTAEFQRLQHRPPFPEVPLPDVLTHATHITVALLLPLASDRVEHTTSGSAQLAAPPSPSAMQASPGRALTPQQRPPWQSLRAPARASVNPLSPRRSPAAASSRVVAHMLDRQHVIPPAVAVAKPSETSPRRTQRGNKAPQVAPSSRGAVGTAVMRTHLATSIMKSITSPVRR